MIKTILLYGQFGDEKGYEKSKAFFCLEAPYDTIFNKISIELDVDLSQSGGCIEFKDKENHCFRLFALKEEDDDLKDQLKKFKKEKENA